MPLTSFFYSLKIGREPVKRTFASFNFNFDTDAAKAQRSFLFVRFEHVNLHVVIT